ncbi:hypothetical protein CAE01nite_33090 [Cellulomonas aerilata]|uniref:Uncharacterized protein n=1 Tax=Cellulomonas aerilata TaxID=515326 RepID=A0A512DGG6_9CELL|nr:hypothetical protein CAE01nite_33090 [Cellulomonas aerilata]
MVTWTVRRTDVRTQTVAAGRAGTGQRVAVHRAGRDGLVGAGSVDRGVRHAPSVSAGPDTPRRAADHAGSE